MDRTQGYYHDLETESESARANRQWQSIQAVVEKALSFEGEFRDRLASADIVADEIRSIDDFTSIPVLRKKDLSRLQREKGFVLVSVPRSRQASRIYQSPGPIYDPEGRGTDYWGWAEAFYAAGFRDGDLAQMTFSYHLTPAGLMLEEPLRALAAP
jgi:Coenzyme F390 synthetase